MGKQNRKPVTPSPALRLQNWAGKTPSRIRDVDDYAREAFLTREELKYPDEPGQPGVFYASSMIPPEEVWER